MTRRRSSLAVTVLVFATMAAGAADSVAQKQQKKLQRCFDLGQQFSSLADERRNEPDAGPAIDKGRRGLTRCNGGAYMVGARLLAEAIKELGARPVSAD